MTTRTDDDFLHPVYRVMGLLRWLLLVHALVVNWMRRDLVAHPGWLLLCCLVMAAWTLLVGDWQSRRATRSTLVVVADVGVTIALVAVSRLVLGRAALVQSYLGVPVYWMAASPLVVAVWRGARWGLAAATLVSVTKFVQEPRDDDRVYAVLVLLGMAVWGLGAIVDTLRESVAERDEGRERAAALAERDRLNRLVHDGALQVLAMVEREGPELGARGAQLAQMARQQEMLLRRRLQNRDLPAVETVDEQDQAMVSLTSLLETHSSRIVTVSVVDDVELPRAVAREVEAAVAEALLNSARHAGPDAQSWVLVEAEGDFAVVTVRDNGVGMSMEQVEQASVKGRLGVAGSIIGRLEDIGGSAVARSQPGRGVEWELRVPLEQA